MDDLFEIKNEKDIVYFLDQCEYFHDSCIFEMHYKSGAYSCEIFKGKLMQRNGVFYRSPEDEFDPEDVSCLTDNNTTWVCCRKIKWRIYDAESGHNN